MGKKSKVKIELNRAAVGQLLKSPEMQALLENCANKMAKGGRTVESYVAATRAVAQVSGDDGNNGLLKAMGNAK